MKGRREPRIGDLSPEFPKMSRLWSHDVISRLYKRQETPKLESDF